MLSDNKNNVNLIAYFTSRFLDEKQNGVLKENVAYAKLGFQTRTEFHSSIATQFGVKQSYVKNMEDSYDAVHDNHRKGWHQRELRPAQQEIIKYLVKVTRNGSTTEVSGTGPGESLTHHQRITCC